MKRFLAAMALLCTTPAMAGIYTDDLSRCLVDKTSTEDKSVLVQWIFVAMAQHPSVVPLTKITPADVDRDNKAAGELFAHPDVLKIMGGLEKYFDKKKLEALSN